MDTKVLQTHGGSTVPLTPNDRKRLQTLYDELQQKAAEGKPMEDYRDTLAFMLERDCKLEQETVNVSHERRKEG